jgi:hypothetical protein
LGLVLENRLRLLLLGRFRVWIPVLIKLHWRLLLSHRETHQSSLTLRNRLDGGSLSKGWDIINRI